jgi:hypothetical protein
MEPTSELNGDRADIVTIVEFALRHKAKITLPNRGPNGERYSNLAYRAAAEKIVEHMHRAGVTFRRNHPPPLITNAAE